MRELMGIFSDWLENKREMVEAQRKEKLAEVKECLRSIPTGKMLMDFADENIHLIYFKEDIDGHAIYKDTRSIVLNPKSSKELLCAFLAHELRHGWQDKQGLSMKRVTKVMDGLVNKRFCEADAFAVEAQVAWELTQHKILPDAWNVYRKENKKLALAYEQAVSKNRNAAENGKAMKAVFNAWFKTSFKNTYDKSSLEDSQRQLQNVFNGKRAYPLSDEKRKEGQSPRMSIDFLREFGQVSDGVNYLEGVNTHSSYYIGKVSQPNLKRIDNLNRKYPEQHSASLIDTVLSN
jgi:hypothetical protein